MAGINKVTKMIANARNITKRSVMSKAIVNTLLTIHTTLMFSNERLPYE